MIRNYLKIAWRSLLKNKVFSFINIFGLSLGIAVCFIIVLFVTDELSYDTFNDKADRIYRVLFQANINGGKINESNVMPPTAQALKTEYPEVEEVTRIRTYGMRKLSYQDKSFKEGRFVFVDASFFRVFTIPLVKGNPQTALQLPNSIVISSAMAKKYFGDAEPLNKTLLVDNQTPMTVTGIIDPMPANSHFHFDQLASMESLPESKENSWLSSNFFTYIVLKKGADYRKLQDKLPGMVEKYMGPQILQAMGMNLAQFRTRGNSLGFALQPLTSIHLHADTSSELEPGGDIKYVYIFSAIAVFMLLIAAINFINLTTAGASKRGKEVAVRKVMGSVKGLLLLQFLLESVFIALVAILVAAVMIQLTLPLFNELSGKNLSFNFGWLPMFKLAALGILVGLLAGWYPAVVLSSFRPIAILKGRFQAGNHKFGLRSSLVVFQFFISVSLIIATLVVYQQMQYIQHIQLGYDKQHLLVLPNSWALGSNEKIFRDQLRQDTRIQNVTVSGYKPAGPSDNNNSLAYPEGKENQLMKTLEYKIDEQYIPTFGMHMAAGRNFSPSYPTDSSAMIINEAAAKAFGFGPQAVGQHIVRENSDRGKNYVYTVIGVVKDFHFKSLHEAITPLLMVLKPEWGIVARVNTADLPALLASMKKQWESFHPEEPFTYSFLDELYAKTYSAEQKTGVILNVFALLTIMVACLGLFGLATHTAEQRAREIGIRKVLGATVGQVTAMLSVDFLRLVLLGCVVSFPLSYWIMHRWLQDFAYRTPFSWWIFVLAGAAALLVALLTVSVKAIRAATANPVQSLRTE